MTETEFEFKINPDWDGARLVRHLADCQNYLGYLSNQLDQATLEYSKQKLHVDIVQEEAGLIKGSSVTSRSKGNYNKYTTPVSIDGNSTTLQRERQVLLDMQFKVNLISSRLNELKSTINTVKAMLHWERVEFVNSQ